MKDQKPGCPKAEAPKVEERDRRYCMCKPDDHTRACNERMEEMADDWAESQRKPAPTPEPKQGSEEPIEPVTELEAVKHTNKILRAQLAKAWAETDEARATKDMHKERQEEAWAEVAALRAELTQAEKACALALDYVQGSPRPRHMDVVSALREVIARAKEGEKR